MTALSKPKPTDYQTAVKEMRQTKNFANQLTNYDILNVSDDTLRKLGKYTKDENFNPDDVGRASKAAAGLCSWVLNVERIAIKSRGLSP